MINTARAASVVGPRRKEEHTGMTNEAVDEHCRLGRGKRKWESVD